MAKQTINQGTAPTGAGGDTFRSGSAKLQANDDEIYSQLGATAQGALPAALPVNKGGTGATTTAAARTNLGLGNEGFAAFNDSVIALLFNKTKVTDFSNVLGTNKFSSVSHGDWQNGSTGNSLLMPQRYGSLFSYNGINSNGTYAYQFFRGFSGRDLFYRCGDGADIWSGWGVFRTGLNTTIDANGFIKNASPVVQLFADRIELNDEARQQEISFEKLGTGDYLIKGSSGFAQTGWYIETPKDANGNVLFSVIYTTLENGDISVKTYKKKFDFETVSIVADLDNPVDITENRWIDLRLQELPQPEIEEPESIAPPEFQPTGLAQAVATVMESYHDPEQ